MKSCPLESAVVDINKAMLQRETTSLKNNFQIRIIFLMLMFFISLIGANAQTLYEIARESNRILPQTDSFITIERV